MSDWASRFPELFTRAYIDYANCDVAFTTGPVPDHLVSRLHCVASNSKGEVPHRRDRDRRPRAGRVAG